MVSLIYEINYVLYTVVFVVLILDSLEEIDYCTIDVINDGKDLVFVLVRMVQDLIVIVKVLCVHILNVMHL